MELPDATLWKAVSETRLSTLLLLWVAIGGTALLCLIHPGWVPEPFGNAHEWIELTAIALSAIAVPWTLWTAIRTIPRLQLPMMLKVLLLAARYKHLDENQARLLVHVHQSGKNEIAMGDDANGNRWFRELIAKGWIDERAGSALVSPSPSYYYLSEAGERALIKLLGP